MTKLKSCPHCGGAAEIHKNLIDRKTYCVKCKDCGARSPLTSLAAAKKAWNRRVEGVNDDKRAARTNQKDKKGNKNAQSRLSRVAPNKG